MVYLGGEFGHVVVNDIDVTDYVEAELDRRHPARVLAREADPYHPLGFPAGGCRSTRRRSFGLTLNANPTLDRGHGATDGGSPTIVHQGRPVPG